MQLKCQNGDHQNKDMLSCRILLLHRKSELGRTKSSTGLHADGGLDIAEIKSFVAAISNIQYISLLRCSNYQNMSGMSVNCSLCAVQCLQKNNRAKK